MDEIDDDEGLYVLEFPYSQRTSVRVFSSWREALEALGLVLLLLCVMASPLILLSLWIYRRLHGH